MHVRIRHLLSGTPVVGQPSYCTNLASTDIFVFRKMESILKGRIISEHREQLGEITTGTQGHSKLKFQQVFQNWKKHFERGIDIT